MTVPIKASLNGRHDSTNSISASPRQTPTKDQSPHLSATLKIARANFNVATGMALGAIARVGFCRTRALSLADTGAPDALRSGPVSATEPTMHSSFRDIKISTC
jgi:hypothetical protein